MPTLSEIQIFCPKINARILNVRSITVWSFWSLIMYVTFHRNALKVIEQLESRKGEVRINKVWNQLFTKKYNIKISQWLICFASWFLNRSFNRCIVESEVSIKFWKYLYKQSPSRRRKCREVKFYFVRRTSASMQHERCRSNAYQTFWQVSNSGLL